MQREHGSYFLGLASDGDGTLLRGSRLAKATIQALKRFRAAKRKLILVTGERADQVREFPHLTLFDAVVAENGGVLYWPRERRTRCLGRKPPAELVRRLRRAHVRPLKIGRSIVAVPTSRGSEVRRILRRCAASWHLVANRHDLLLLPRGVDKASGLKRLLRLWGIPASRIVGIGDADNDRALLRACGLGVAVDSAVPSLKRQAEVRLRSGAGGAVVSLIDQILNREASLRKKIR